MQQQYVEIDGQRLRVGTWTGCSPGTPPLLVCNGFSANLEILEPFVNALNGPRVISFDAPGVGQSDNPRRFYRFRDLAQLLAKLLDYLDVEIVDVLGVSWGGGLAQEFAYRQPGRCRRLILAATSPGVIMVPGSIAIPFKLGSPRRLFDPAYVARVAPSIYGGKIRTDPQLVRQYARFLRFKSLKGYLGQVYAMAGWTSFRWLPRVQQPVLVMLGKDDPIVPVKNGALFRRRLPHVSIVEFDCGHLFMLTEVDEVASVVIGFLTDLRHANPKNQNPVRKL